ncbi:AGE family epimerase/isomerase [Neokomagataea thailandica]|uniref:N-acylglucosamine 2-epimerase n=1 Tax=Neokomagataea tanensis NBRC 106556 TaxID=1223519 RepID=A0ABQ0QFV3_9PROT|nr:MULTISPECIES: AGE family epimerase/isomerase [Neokomagataea]GBR43230.1 N-acylglucosamine 2-epimerase [Neokomagataea tanensis NBRC 106556]
MFDRLSPVLLDSSTWIRQPAHTAWLKARGEDLLLFSRKGQVDGGFTGLDLTGHLPPKAAAEATLTARCAHAFAAAALKGIPGSAALSQHALNGLRSTFQDTEHGGWRHYADKPHERKQAYLHAFIALAASSATVLGLTGAKALLHDATTCIEQHFWSENEGVMRESFAADWSDEEDYRGANSNMHSTEAFLALADVTGDTKWLHRALRIVTRFVHELAASQNFAMPEHFDRNWTLLKDYHHDQPTHDLRPYGMTPGHFVEWSHLTLKLEASLLRHGLHAPGWLLHDAQSLFKTGMHTGWNTDGKPGLIYTIGWDHKPHISARVHWAQAEALTAAILLYKRTGNTQYEEWYRTIWDYIDTTLIDRTHGSWFNEVTPEGIPSETIYQGKADLYHAYQSTLAPLMPAAPSLVTALRATQSLSE